MPLKPKTIEKLYWTIGEVAEELGVNNSTIRFWEKEFGMSAARRTVKGDRQYTRKEIEQFQRIQQLVKDEGYTLNGAKARLQKTEDPEAPHINIDLLRERLLQVRRKLVELARQSSQA